MNITTKVASAIVATTLAAGLGAAPAQAAAKPIKFSSCAKMNAKYPYGVAKSKDADLRTPGLQKVSKAIYSANYRRLDRDRDGVACERD